MFSSSAQIRTFSSFYVLANCLESFRVHTKLALSRLGATQVSH